MVSTPVAVAGIIRLLQEDALKGSATSAKKLRSWLHEYPTQDNTFDREALDEQASVRVYAVCTWLADDEERWAQVEALLSGTFQNA
jgi:hypothetical protein